MKQIASVKLENLPVGFFYQAILIYLKKTQVVNRKLSGSSNVSFYKLKAANENEIQTKIWERLKSASNEEDVKTVVNSLGAAHREQDIDKLRDAGETTDGIFLSIDRMSPRNSQKFKTCLQVAVIDPSESSIRFHAVDDSTNLLPKIDYELSYCPRTNELKLNVDDDTTDEASNGLKFVLLKKIQSWMESCANENAQTSIGSHELIDSELYNKTYAELKEKYGQKLEANWNESTDPKKFIYEDIAIASYLISLWKRERRECDELQSFADLGCGNGLLVYILSQEGHRGYGIDLRKRRIWDQFPSETDLREEAIVPSDSSLFPDVDWIIGNHSDELSPWIPVIAARSSFRTKYFLLPCCAFEFSGAKYQKKGNKSQYLSFIDYLMTVSEVCGFADTKLDRLKIPSTKRICLVGSARSFDENEFESRCEAIQNFINESNSQRGTSSNWANSFKPRDKIEVSRNCTKVQRSLLDTITMKIFEHLLLQSETFCDDFPDWNCGGEITIPEAVSLISHEDLKQLKAECGGLQTLLRNKHQTFQAIGGKVRIRIPKKLSQRKFSEKALRSNVIKTSPCFFYRHHPSSCPLENDDCSFLH